MIQRILAIPSTDEIAKVLFEADLLGVSPALYCEGPLIEGRTRWVSPAKLEEYRLLQSRGAQWIPPFPFDQARHALVLALRGRSAEYGSYRLGKALAVSVGMCVDEGIFMALSEDDYGLIFLLEDRFRKTCWSTQRPPVRGGAIPAFANPPELGPLLKTWALGRAALASGVLSELICDAEEEP